MKNLEARKQFCELAMDTYGTDTLSRTQINNLAKVHQLPDPAWLKSDKYRVARGKYQMPSDETTNISAPVTTVPSNNVVNMQVDLSYTENLVPAKDPSFVKFGNFEDLKTIISSNMFYPVFITGLSGNGKTFGTQQACAQLKRECIVVPITVETDESDLLGDKTLIDGNVSFVPGPVIRAMERGAVLVLDEVDLASNKIMCLQSIVDGKGVYLKKDNRFVEPAPGFTIVATANTKGKGSDDGRFVGTNVMNEAFLERFKITFEQEYPNQTVEKKILTKVLDTFGMEDDSFIMNLTVWAQTIRKTFEDGGIDDVISTRRLVHIIETYAIFKDRVKSIELCTNRFDDDTKSSFVDLYQKISDDGVSTEEVTGVDLDKADGEEIPF
jgi:hypothetical protein